MPKLSDRHALTLVSLGSLTFSFAIALSQFTLEGRLGWIESWVQPHHLDANAEGLLANFWTSMVWGTVGVLGATYAVQPPRANCRRLTWMIGGLSVSLLAFVVALEEILDLRVMFEREAAGLSWVPGAQALPTSGHWLFAAFPLIVPLVAAVWFLERTSRGNHATRVLLVMAAGMSIGAVAKDIWDPMTTWLNAVEEGNELMSAAIMSAALVELLVRPTVTVTDASALRLRRFAIPAAVALLAGFATAALAGFQRPDEGWDGRFAGRDAGPLMFAEQTFDVRRDYLTRIELAASVEDTPGATAEIFGRIIPDGETRPIRESRATVRHVRNQRATVDLNFEPIPDSAGQRFHLHVGVLGGPEPYVFLRLVNGEVTQGSGLVFNGVPDQWRNKLVMQPYWVDRGHHALRDHIRASPRLVPILLEVVMWVWLWVFAVVVAWIGSPLAVPRHWALLLWHCARISVITMAAIMSIVLMLGTWLWAVPRM